jgi:hypothetical protein
MIPSICGIPKLVATLMVTTFEHSNERGRWPDGEGRRNGRPDGKVAAPGRTAPHQAAQPAGRARRQAAHGGRPRTAAGRARRQAAHGGRPRTAAGRARRQAAHGGRPHTAAGRTRRPSRRQSQGGGQSLQGSHQTQAQPPEPAGVTGAVPVSGPSGRARTPDGLAGPAAPGRPGTSHPCLAGPDGGAAGHDRDRSRSAGPSTRRLAATCVTRTLQQPGKTGTAHPRH